MHSRTRCKCHAESDCMQTTSSIQTSTAGDKRTEIRRLLRRRTGIRTELIGSDRDCACYLTFPPQLFGRYGAYTGWTGLHSESDAVGWRMTTEPLSTGGRASALTAFTGNGHRECKTPSSSVAHMRVAQGTGKSGHMRKR